MAKTYPDNQSGTEIETKLNAIGRIKFARPNANSEKMKKINEIGRNLADKLKVDSSNGERPVFTKEEKKLQESVHIYYEDSLSEKLLEESIKIKDSKNKSNKPQSNPRLEEIALNAGKRVVISKDRLIRDHEYEDITPKDIHVLAMSGPIIYENGPLKGHATVNQRTKFVDNDELKVTTYLNELMMRYELAFKAMDAEGVEVAIMPPVGQGDFLKGLDDENKKIAYDLHMSAISDVLKSLNLTNLHSVVLCIGDSKIKGIYEKKLKKYEGEVSIILTDLNMVKVTETLAEDYKVCYIVADHPTQRVGNGWNPKENRGNSSTAQEELSTRHLEGYLFTHEHKLNPKVLSNKHALELQNKSPFTTNKDQASQNNNESQDSQSTNSSQAEQNNKTPAKTGIFAKITSFIKSIVKTAIWIVLYPFVFAYNFVKVNILGYGNNEASSNQQQNTQSNVDNSQNISQTKQPRDNPRDKNQTQQR